MSAPPSITHRTSGITHFRVFLLAALLVGAVLLSYQPAWHAGFIWDDDFYVTHNPLLTAPDGLARIWFSTDSPSQYFPLVYTNFRLQHALWGFDPAGYHWVNILFHAANALLVWRLLFRLAIPGAWIAAVVFALHPLQVESVAWITELKNVQSLFFSLLTVLAWLRFTERSRWHRLSACDSDFTPRPFWPFYAAALACHALALFSKTTACTIPAALVLVLWIRRQPLNLARWIQIVPFVLMGLVMGLVSIWWEKNQQGTVGDEFAYGALDRLLIAARALSFYFGKFLWPENLTFSYTLWPIDPRSPAGWAWFLPLATLAAAVFALRRRLGRGPEAALVFFAATLLPLLGFFMLYTFRYTFVADHYVYVALIGLAALVGAGAARLAPRIRSVHTTLPAALCAALVLGLGALTWRQSRMYHDLRTLWETTIARNPASFMAHNNLGSLHLAEGRTDEAVACFEHSLALNPRHTHALANLANARLVQGRPSEALALFRQVVELSPHDAKAHADLGQALESSDAPAEAEPHYRRAIALDPQLAEGHFLLGRSRLAAGIPAEAGPLLERALALHEPYAEAHYHLGLVRLAEERPTAAAACFERTLALAPDHLFALRNLGLLLAGSSRTAEAIPRLEHALALRPDFTAARLDLAQAQITLGRYAAAAATLEVHLSLHPDDFEARHGLGRVLLAAGRPAEAAAAFRRVLASSPDHPEARADLAGLQPPAS